MKHEPRTIRDGQTQFLGGVDGGRSPSEIDPNQVSHATNVTFRGGQAKTRPAFTKRTPIFEDIEQQAWIADHQLQGGYTYRAAISGNFDVLSFGGRFFKFEPLDSYKISEITPAKTTATTVNFIAPAIGASVTITVTDASLISIGYPIKVNGHAYTVTDKTGNDLTATNVNDPTAGLVASGASVIYLDPNSPVIRRVYFEQAKQWLIAQNGLDDALLFDGGSMRRAVLTGDKPEVPTGTVMAFTHNRLWVAVPGNQIAAGDIANGPTDVIVFAEELGISGPARFQVDDEPTAMVKSVTLDTSLGQGPLQIFTRNGAGSINVPASRALWSQLNYAIQTVSLDHAGACSHYACVNVNSDIHYRSPDGWRSFIMARREVSEWGNTPISAEMERIIGNDDESLLQYGSAVLIDNRVLFTFGPRVSDNGIVHSGLAVIDFNLVSRMGTKSRPIWEGEWTGLNPTLILSGSFNKIKRAFIFVLNADNQNEIWEVDRRATTDNGTRIVSGFETRNFVGQGSNPFDLKKISTFELWPRQVKGTVDFDLKWRPDASEKQDEAPCWYNWGTRQICSKVEDCDQNVSICKTVKNYKAGYRNRLGFGTPPDDDCEPQTMTPPRLGFEHQIKLTWTGHCAIKKFLVKFGVVEEDVFPPCDE